MRDPETGDRDEADRPRPVRGAEALDDPDPGRSIAPDGQGLGGYQFAVKRTGRVGQLDKVFGAVAAIGRVDAAAVMVAAVDANDARGGLALYGFAGRRDEPVPGFAAFAAAGFLARAAALRAGFAVPRRAVPLTVTAAGLRGLRAGLPFAF